MILPLPRLALIDITADTLVWRCTAHHDVNRHLVQVGVENFVFLIILYFEIIFQVVKLFNSFAVVFYGIDTKQHHHQQFTTSKH